MYKKGTVILVPFPFTDLSGNKVRPAVIVSNNMPGDDVVVLFITSKIKNNVPHLVVVKANKENGLKLDSKIVCDKLATLDSKIVLGELGNLSDEVLVRVDIELRTVLGL